MAATNGQQYFRPGFFSEQFGQSPPYGDKPPYHGPPAPYGYSHGYSSFAYPGSSVMQLPIEIPPTSEKTVMASSCSKVQQLYKEIIAKEKEYEEWKWPYSNSSSVYGELGIHKGSDHRFYRLQIEGDFLALAQKVQNLHEGKARGAEYLLERIWTIMTSIHTAIEEDLTFLEKCLDDESKQQKSGEQSESILRVTDSRSRSEYSNLVTRVEQFASMRKTFKRSDITLPNGRVCSLTVNAISLSYKLQAIERKLPDSEFVKALKSFAKGVEDFFFPTPSPQSTYTIPLSSEQLRREQQRTHDAYIETMQSWTRVMDQRREMNFEDSRRASDRFFSRHL